MTYPKSSRPILQSPAPTARPVARNNTNLARSSTALLARPITVAGIVADTARGIAETHMMVRDRRERRQVLLATYIAQIGIADRREERAHESLRALIVLATRLVETGHVDAAVELLSRLAPALTGGSPPALPPHLDGGP